MKTTEQNLLNENMELLNLCYRLRATNAELLSALDRAMDLLTGDQCAELGLYEVIAKSGLSMTKKIHK
jgi:hypothetical protein